jgi:YebC/PmpR family DNA-binding regulatory protein
MSGHSKWATIKRKKAATDAARGKAFSRIIKEITIAARGGGDPDANPRLRTAIDAAKGVNMPAANITRAIQRGTGELEGATYEEMTYEGYAAAGVAILVDVATDNKNRTGGDIRNLFTKNGGSLGEPGSVAWMFESRGLIEVERGGRSEDELLETALDAGADDVEFGDEAVEIRTSPGAFEGVKKALAAAGLTVTSAEQTKIPSNTIELDEAQAKSVLRLVDALEGHEDVQKMYANFQIADDVLARIAG